MSRTVAKLVFGILLLLAADARVRAQFAAPHETQLQVPPAEGWTAESKEGTVTLGSAESGVLTIDYQLKIERTVMLGFRNFDQATARVLLKNPIRLGQDDLRLLFECRGMDRILNREGKIQIMPLVRDREGELFICEPYAYPHINFGTKGWALWTTAYLYSGEAGGPTQNVYQTEGKGNGWPDVPLDFIGFEIQVRGKKGDTVQGRFAIGEMFEAGMRMPLRPPFLYADSIMDKGKGKFTFEAEAATDFQGRPAYAVEEKFDFDDASLLSRKKKFFLPTGPEGFFWADYSVRDDQGATRSLKSLDYRVDAGVRNEKTRKLPADAPSQLRLIEVSTAGEVPGVVPRGKPFGVTVEVNAVKGAGKLELKWTLHPARFTNELATGEAGIPKTPWRGFIELPETPGRDAYRLEAKLLLDGKPIGDATYYVGRPTDFSAPYAGRTGHARLRDEVKGDAYFRTTFIGLEKPATEEEYLADFHNYLREATKMARDVTITIDPARFEILPGVFDLATMDRMMDMAADYGAGITVRTVHQDSKLPFLWPKLERQRNFDGTEIYQHYYGNFSPHDPVYLALWQRANRAVFDRYKNHPSFQGYYLMHPAGETVIMDQPWLGITTGYSGYARVGFRQYLQKQMGLDLAQLNQRWSTHYTGWDQVEPPLPDFALQKHPDLRPAWLDFCAFKAYVDRIGWFLDLARDIRSYDPTHVIIAYANVIEPLKDLIDYTHGGGVMHDPEHGEMETYWLKNGVGAIQESTDPRHWGMQEDPAGKGWALDYNLYTMYSRTGGGGMNLHIYYSPVESILKKYGGISLFDRYTRFKPIMGELQQTEIATPLNKQVAVLQEPLTLFTKHRTVFSGRLYDLARWFLLWQQIGVDYEQFRESQVANYRLVLPNLIDEVLPRQRIDELADYVKKGGKMIIAANTGRYNDVPGSEPFPLLRALGIKPPVGNYVTTGLDVTAQPVPGAGPLTDGLPPLSFYTVERQGKEARQPREYSDFQRWPYRWLSESDYFGFYPGQKPDGTVLARFADGGAAISLHQVGAGAVVVFWGTPDYQDKTLLEFLKRALVWAKVGDDAKLNPIPLMIEARNQKLGRHYAILWDEKPGIYHQRFPQAPDGKWLLVDLVSDQRLGVFDGAALRQDGIDIEYRAGYSPLKVIRMQSDLPYWAEKTTSEK